MAREIIVNGPGDVDDAMRRLSRVIAATYSPENSARILVVTGINIVNRVVKAMRKHGTGIVYTRRGISHQASSPGSAPAADLGRLMDSYTWQLGADARGPYVDVGTNVDYAPALELGTSEIEPRPALRPAAEAERGLIARRNRNFYAETLAKYVRAEGGS